MKYNAIALLVVALFLQSEAFSMHCPEKVFTDIHDYQKNTIKEISWLDINTTESSYPKCFFNIRFYPCNALTIQKIDDTLTAAIKSSSVKCDLYGSGEHRREQGYCVLEDAALDCHL